ncbi:ketoacyl-synt-domain-containing protein [Aspergillus heteromorphus CBS 117.55]|uniref:Ketoacyl-synt-domain-containing protein n=1 Tax=Aspergillus heteromorphus CBS 117.55 TaxID=1448321 RepID=A0A317W6H8_9EURO|nr:ketoacyl-synt-domain-containing protein [Aspergillus heteromorphus CBS 117.55]PWY82224.1 ketoacyl-synt-domain-containing protein [Aspergillus heteromorphus CBS 117.55]
MAFPEPVAIIGTGCRFPGAASSPSKLWDLLHHPRNLASKIPSDRFNHSAFYHQDNHHGTSSSPESYFLSEDIYAFDAPFFNISHAEAESMDPQQRLLLEVVYESLERAGLQMERLRGSNTGVFCGLMNMDYGNLISGDWDEIPTYASSGTAASMLSNRLSFFFDWRGPSMTIDTACSSSLVALHQGVCALRSGDCRMAVVAASNLILSPREYIAASNMRLLSPTGRCRMWDENADGYARGEGVAAVVLKPLSDAIAAGDHIESIIRATGVNADGRTMGLTIPSSIAQSQLIRSTYASVGLDPQRRPEDRCQLFEAHGTGTQAGDPQEASAIYESLFGDTPSEDVLYVGSIKTIIGHTEGTAGLASVIKASLSIQQGIIPPNLLFNRINPVIAPVTSHLRVPTEPLPWPSLSRSSPRRVSVNSFGFGGSNAHAIIESYTPPVMVNLEHELSPQVLPFAFSAVTERTLTNVLERYVEFLQRNPQIDLLKFAAALIEGRSAFSHRVILTATSVGDLQRRIQAELKKRNSTTLSSSIVSRANDTPKQVLGIFTGQGAQYPQMFWDSISASPKALVWMAELQESLDTLPPQLRPSFSMVEEISNPEPLSSLHKAGISQPLRTAIQIIQVNMLRALGITFSAVIGHSSGEIVAAYAADAITATDAIRIAYLRGIVTKQAGANGQSGAMIAGGIPWQEAQALCDEGGFSGRVRVAASNSPVSVTFSGDTDAVQDLEWMLKSLDITVNHLHVYTAYHSHHMIPCAEPYLHSLESSDIQAHPLTTKWFSSVYEGKQLSTEDLSPQYWTQNMLRPVLFSQAVTAAFADNPGLNLVVEIGPHPTLKGPVLQTLSGINHREPQIDIPYFGLAKRGGGSVETFAHAVGLFWAYLQPKIDIQRYLSLFDNDSSYGSHILKHMPTYTFDKRRTYRFTSRLTKARLHRVDPPHPLLGALSPEAGDNEWRWRNYLSRGELEWLNGHRFQSQIVFPATGYIVMALEAAAVIAHDQSLRLVELDEVLINRALHIPNDMTGVEIIFKVEQISTSNNVVFGAFRCYASVSGVLKTCVSGKLTVTMGEYDAMLLPPKSPVSLLTRPVDIDEFYTCLEKVGLGYSGSFRGIKALTKCTNRSMGTVSNNGIMSSLLLHPATIDCSLQGLLAAMDIGQLHTLRIPVAIDHVSINPMFCNGSAGTKEQLAFEAFLHSVEPDGATGDVSTFDLDGHGIYQIEGFHVAPLMLPEDRPIFSEIVWGPLLPQVTHNDTSEDSELNKSLKLAEYCALLHIRDTRSCITPTEYEHLDWHRRHIVDWMDRVLSMTSDGTHPICHPYWLGCTVDYVRVMESMLPSKSWAELRTAGERLLDFIRGSAELLRGQEQFDRPYNDPFESQSSNFQLATFVEQIAFRFPRMNILEVAAGRGSATETILSKIKQSYRSYTFTDISPALFAEAQTALSDHKDRFLYKVLDIGLDPFEQGFTEHSYDLVIVAGTMPLPKRLEQTLHKIRRLLKPGGYLVVRAGTNTDINRVALMFGSIKSWWYDEEEGISRSPVICIQEWEKLLKKTGFGGFQAILPAGQLEFDSTFVSQAIDDRTQLLHDPWNFSDTLSDKVLLVGGATEATADIVQELKTLLAPHFSRLVVTSSLEAMNLHDTFGWCALSLTDLDSQFYENLMGERFNGLKILMNNVSKLLWVTAGPESAQPYWGVSKAMVHCMAYENPQSVFQYLNILDHREATAQTLATNFIRLVHAAPENDHSLEACVDSTEFELRLVQGVLKIPRIRMSDSMNQRYSANRRVVQHHADLQRSVLEVVAPSGKRCEFALRETVQSECRGKMHGAYHRQIRVLYSTFTAFKVDGAGFLYLILGRDAEGKTRWLALSYQNASVVDAPLEWCWQVPDLLSEATEPIFLMKTAAALIALHVINQGRRNTSVLVHGAENLPESVRDALSALALTRDIRLYFSTSIQSTLSQKDMLFIHERTSSRDLSRLLPAAISVIAKCPGTACGIYCRIETLLPEDIMRVDIASLGRMSSSLLRSSSPVNVGQTLLMACGVALQLGKSHDVDLISAQDLSRHTPGSSQLTLLDWSQPGKVSVLIQTASSMVTLYEQKTYLLVGMTGDLGQSVCRWMISRGARSVVLASRAPNIDPRWIEEMATMGAHVLGMEMDVTSRESICRAHDTIRSTLPPIGGVVNGAMVLNDCLFTQMTLDDMQRVLAPKVQGSIHLNDVFGSYDLDFFILVGSAAGPLGNVGQTAYSAATEFMSALIQQRREQGLVGSIIHPGLIKGVGYFARADRAVQDMIEKNTGTPDLTEHDVHELFAEGILAGRPNSGRDPEVIAGYKVIDPAENPNALWLRNPKAWNLVGYGAHSVSQVSGSSDGVPMKVQLKSAKSMDDAIEAIAQGFIKAVRLKLQLSNEESLTGVAALTELGVDSLVAIELRQWFVKELAVDLPVLQIIGGSSIRDLSTLAASKLSSDSIPNVQKGESQQRLVIDE